MSLLEEFKKSLPSKYKIDRTHQSPVRPRQKMPTIYRHKINEKTFLLPDANNFDNNSSLGLQKLNERMKRKLDQDVIRERSEMLIMSGRTSEDNPEWMNSSFQYYKRSNFQRPRRVSLAQQKRFDVFNNEKQQYHGRNEDNYYNNLINSVHSQYSPEISSPRRISQQGSNDFDRSMRKTLNWTMANQRQISQKVGSLETRDYTIPRPLLKIGKNGSFVDTYSPF